MVNSRFQPPIQNSQFTMYYKQTIYTILLLLPLTVFTQESESSWQEKLSNFSFQPVVALQIWSSYTLGEEIYDATNRTYKTVDDRLDFQLRRSRLGFKGQAYKNLKFNLTAAIDLVGRDVLSGTEAGANNGGSPQLRLWNAYLQWRLINESEKLNFVTGYFPVQIGRESITAASRSTSMEKSWSQNYLRRHLVGTGPGRAVGANFGGLFINKNRNIHWGYDLGIFNPAFREYNNNSTGDQYAPLLSGRLAFYIGDPESSKYTIGHKINYFGKRKGLTLALAGAYQGTTNLFTSNAAYGGDFLLNLGNLNIDGEWHYLIREGEEVINGNNQMIESSAGTGYLRMSYNILLQKGYILEPSAMIVRLNGALSAADQEMASTLGTFAGEEQILDIGFNLYFNPNLKLSLHYTHREGDAGAAGDGSTLNNYFSQNSVGAIRRGNWAGLGVVVIL